MDRRPERVSGPHRWRLGAFQDAIRGLAILVRTQPNARFHLLAAIGAIGLSAWLRITAGEWAAITLAITMVWTAEALNTGIEFAVDLVSPEHHKLAGWAKDVAAGGVLVASVGALAIGALVFVPRLLVEFWPG
jgi:diacylglycerol kinase